MPTVDGPSRLFYRTDGSLYSRTLNFSLFQHPILRVKADWTEALGLELDPDHRLECIDAISNRYVFLD